jgi:ribosomal protein S18 acetylase RimI-like enzyme
VTTTRPKVTVRTTRPGDFDAITTLSRRVYPLAEPWAERQLRSHLAVFPEGQFVATAGDQIVGMAASLIVRWDDYDLHDNWRDWTGLGMFTNHDPDNGHTLYGAEVMVDPDRQGQGIGKALYAARRDLAITHDLWRIRAGARLRGYAAHAARLTPRQYVEEVVAGRLADPTLSFQLAQGFRVIGVVGGYLANDPESLGYAAVIEWLNPHARPS